MRNSLWDKRIPTLLGLFLIVIGIGLTTALIQSGVVVVGRASPSEKPENLRITNISDTSFTVSYKTPESVTGVIAYGKTAALGQVVQDDRDASGGVPVPHALHYFTVQNLEPETAYSFTIESGKNIFGQEIEGNPPFVVTTYAAPQPQDAGITLTGTVVSPDDSPLPEAIVYLNTKESGSISSIVQSDGTYALPLNTLRDTDGNPIAIPEASLLTLLVVSATSSSTATLSPPADGKVPTITLSQNYDFTQGDAPLAPGQEASSSAEVTFPVFATEEVVGTEKDVQILTPAKDASLTDDKPQFKGTAVAGEDVQITIHSDAAIETTVTADRNGNWSFRPTTPLSPGEHTITISSRDAFGILKTITQSFTVFAAGSQVSQTATPSATIVPTATTAPTGVPTITPSPTVGPSLTPSPTVLITLTPTVFLTPTIAPTIPVVVQPTVVPPGSSIVTTIGFTAVIMTAIGIILFLAAHLASL